MTKGVASFANVTHLGAECAARWGGAEQWRCLFGEYRLPLVRTPYMAIGSQFDTYQMDNDFGTCGHWGCYPHTPAEVQYAWGLANRTADLARALAVGQRFLFSSRCHRHAVSLSTWQFVMPGCGGLSLQAALRTPLDSNPPHPTFGTGAACCRNKCGLLLLTRLRGPPRRRSQFASWSSRASCRRCGSSRSARSSAAAAAPPPVEDAPPARSALACPAVPKREGAQRGCAGATPHRRHAPAALARPAARAATRPERVDVCRMGLNGPPEVGRPVQPCDRHRRAVAAALRLEGRLCASRRAEARSTRR